ncbi:conjugal transfer protein MobB [Alistipes timonensis]|uniref:conjugal transfer protein MobB n=1 Tax=Alistipes timonensis TaxID=1465754 RepID=UPI00189B75B2|nr:conjugal transfer protein MobB [Alistipes timonensis]
MVGRITKGASIRGVLEYNAEKVRNGEASVLYGNLVLGDCEQSNTFDMRRALLSFQPYLDTRKIKDPVFHVSLNPDITDCLTDAQLTEIAREYMECMGFGDQPYYVFKHRDIDREHIHIVSVRLRDDGSIISDSNERYRTGAIMRDIEQRYGLRPAVKGQEQREFDTARRVEYGRDNLKQQMKSAVRLLAEQYRFGSITEYRTLLNLYNVDLEERKGEANGKRWNGIVYTATDERGEWVGTPIKSSALTSKGGYTFLQKQIARSDADIKSEQIKGPIRGTVARAMHRARTQDEFVRLLKTDGIDAVFRQNAAGRITGATFVDHRTKTVLNGSRLGKSYSANVFQELFKNPAADRASLLPKLTAPAPPRRQTAEQPKPQRSETAAQPRVVPPAGQPAEQPAQPAPTPPRQTEKIHTSPRGLSSQPRTAQPRGLGESLAGVAGDLLGQLAEDGPMSQDEFEALRQNLSRKRKHRKKQNIPR